jgi:L-threonylcarbamoyladenylate synthase
VGEDVDVSLVFDCADPAVRPGAIEAAVRTVGSGQLVVLPTDTVYGVGADAFSSEAVAALLETKGRGRNVPVPVLVGSWETIEGLVTYVPAQVRALIEAFWPGGLTLVVEHAPSLSWDLGDARGTVAVRMPLHPVALELLARTGPMAVSSANRHGQPAALTVEQARDQLGEQVPLYLDGGPVSIGVASTIVDVTREVPRVLRAGAVGVDELRELLPTLEIAG